MPFSERKRSLLQGGAAIAALALTVTACSSAIDVDTVRHADAAPAVVFDVPERADSTPSVAASGSFVAVAWGASAEGAADVYVATSDDRGETFGAPMRVNAVPGEGRLGGELPPRVAVHPSEDGGPPDVVVLWTARGEATEIKAARSRDGGRSFEAPVVLQAAGAAGDRGWPSLALDTRGRAHAIWLDHRGIAARRAAAAQASGGSAAATGNGHAHANHGGMDGAIMARGSALMHASFGGEADRATESEITSGVCYCCKTSLAFGDGDTLYAAWRHVYPGNLRDIAVAVSRDGGRSFSSPTRVSEDRWMINGCPDDGPSIAVDAEGVLHVVWQTVITGEGDEPEGALFYATSRDGVQFTPRLRIPTLGTPRPSHPQVAIGADGRIVVAWDEVVDGRHVAAMREILPHTDEAAGAGRATFGDVVRVPASGAARNPVLAITDGGVFTVWVGDGNPSRVEARTLQLP